ncbi:tumor necrosis factor ligand superfamily member 10-like [Saccoglossus kowalevskii]
MKTQGMLQRTPDAETNLETDNRCTCTKMSETRGVSTSVTDEHLPLCCTADEDDMRKLILKVIDEDEQQRNRGQTQDEPYVTIRDVQRLIEQIIHHNKTEIIAGNTNSFPFAVHVTGRPSQYGFTANKRIRKQPNYKKVGPWECHDGKSFTKQVHVDEHHIVVPKSGIYYVYSQVYFRDDSGGNERLAGRPSEYLHYTVRENRAYQPDPIDLMKSGRTQGHSDFYYSSFHSGLFRLMKNDKIYMKVYLPDDSVRLDSQQESTFMGMYFLSDDN